MAFTLPQTIDETDAAAVIRWASATFAEGLVFTASFEDPVLVHLVASHAPTVPVALLDTQYLFSETLEYAEQLQRQLGFTLRVFKPTASVVPDDQWRDDVEGCCARRKVEPLNRALAGASAWITGIRRVDAPTRTTSPVVGLDPVRGITKVNPIVAWSDDDMDAYIRSHNLPRNPLTDRGYASIGCWPCTRPIQPGEDRRAGRWSGQEKTECGLHIQ